MASMPAPRVPATVECRWFWAWAGSAAFTAFGVVAILSIGLPFLVAGSVWAGWLLVAAARRGVLAGAYWALPGLLAGAGAPLLLVAYLNRDTRPCGPGPLELQPGQASVSCGGLDPAPWLQTGAVLVVAGTLTFALVRLIAGHRAQPG